MVKDILLIKNEFVFLTIFLLFSSLSAQETTRKKSPVHMLISMNLEDLMKIKVSSATLFREELENTPATMYVITKEDIARKGFRSLVDVLNSIPGIKLDRYSGPVSIHEFTIRGLRANEAMPILLDGRRISTPNNEPISFFENFPIHMARQIEVLIGPSSAVYGADAVAGIINIITEHYHEMTGSFIEASLVGGEFGMQNTQVQFGKALGHGFETLIACQYFKDDQPDLTRFYSEEYKDIDFLEKGTFPTSFGPMTPVEKPAPHYSMPLEAYALTAILRNDHFQFSFFKNFSSVPSSTSYAPKNAIYNSSAFIENHTSTTSLTYKDSLTDRITFESSISYRELETNPESNFRNLYTEMNPGYKYSFGSALSIENRIFITASEHSQWTCGFTFERFQSIPKGADLATPVDTSTELNGFFLGTDIPAKFYHLKFHNSGGFLQYQHRTSHTSLTLGGRYDENSRYGGKFNPRAGLVYRPFKSTRIKFMYGSSFLAPSPYYSYAYHGSFISDDDGQTYYSEFMHLPNPNLKPRETDSYEVSFIYIPSPNFLVSTSIFYNKSQNLLILKKDNPDASNSLYHGSFLGWPVNKIRTYFNEGKEYNQGLSLTLTYSKEWSNGSLKTSGSLNYVDGKVDDPGYETKLDLPVTPGLFNWNTDISFNAFDITASFRWVDNQRTFALNHKNPDPLERKIIPGYTLLDLHIRYNVPEKNVSLFLTGDNIMDSRFKSVNKGAFHGIEMDGVPQIPRRIAFGVSFAY